jgi:hypothetical protein
MRMTFVLGAVLSCVGIATPSTATWNPTTGCDVHERRLISGTVDVNYHEVCTQAAVDALAAVHESDPYPLPCQYTDLALGTCTPGDPPWPIVLDPFTVIEAPPDRGYRYPLVRTATATSTVDTTQWLSPFDPGCTSGCPVQDQWPVCVTQDGSGVVSDIVSDPYDDDGECPESYTRVGFCRGAAHYYERLATPATSRPGDRFYSFVHDEASCTPCGHEVVSAVETCKYLCRRYFGTLRFDTGTSTWIEGTTLALGDHEVEVGGEPMPALDACVANCGPPNAATPATPWVSELGGAPDDKHNHWYFVQYGRGWNPNDNLDNWVRSYTVNRDKATAPANKCQDWVNSYCNAIIPAGQTAKRKTCKKNLLQRTGGPLEPDLGVTPTMFDDGTNWVLNLPDDGRNVDVMCPSASTPPDDEADGFCTHFYRGNMLCPNSCYFRGNDGEFNGHHLCGAAIENECLGGGDSYCHQERAVCVTCADDDGDPIDCPSLTIAYPEDTDLNPNDGTVTTTASQVGVVALFEDGHGNPIGPGGSPYAVSGVWVATPQFVYGQASFGFGHWVTQPVTLVQGENIIFMTMKDQYLNAASAQIKIIKP